MDAYVEDEDTLFTEVFAHLTQVERQPAAIILNEDLLKRAERSLDASTPQDLLWRLLRTGERLLQTLQQDPRPLTRLLEKIVLLIPFDELKTSISSQKLEDGLQSPFNSIQLLCLAYLRKAADLPSGASFVAASSSLVQCLMTVWLASESTEVSERALECIVALLAVDSPETLTVMTSEGQLGQAQGQGLLWRRLFHDPAVYMLMFAWTSLLHSKHDLESKEGLQLVTISQARLFDFIARLAQLDWAAITTSSLTEVEAQYVQETDKPHSYGGILQYAASSMINKSDFLMEVLRRDFFVKLLDVVQSDEGRRVPPRLFEAIQHETGPTEHTQPDGGDVHL